MAARPSAALFLAAAIVFGAAIEVRAQPAVDAHAEVAAALFASSATATAIEKTADAKIRAQQEKIRVLAAAVTAGDVRRRVDLAAAQEAFITQLADKDRAYAQEIAIFRGAVSDIAKTPEGAAALARFNAGDRVGALAIIHRLNAANDAALEKRTAIEKAVGRRDEAALALEARSHGDVSTANVVALYEQVVALDPGMFDDWVTLARLYLSSGNLGEAQHAADALAHLADDDQHRAWALGYLGNVADARGDSVAALADYRESLEINRRLSLAAPNDRFRREYVANTLINIAGESIGQEDFASTRRAYDEAIAIHRANAALDPGNETFKIELTNGLNGLGVLLIQRGDALGASQAFTEEVSILRSRLAADPKDAARQQGLAWGLAQEGLARASLGDEAAAMTTLQQALAIFRHLATADPTDTDPIQGLTFAATRMAQAASTTTGSRAAVAACDEAAAAVRRAVAAHTDALFFQSDLLYLLAAEGRVLTNQVDWVRASEVLDEAVSIARSGAAATPSGAQSSPDLAWPLSLRADLYKRQGNLVGARKLYAEVVAIKRRAAASNPQRASDLAYTLSDFADLDLREGDLAAAQAGAEESVAMLRQLRAAQPRDDSLVRVAARALNEAGMIALERGDIDAATHAFDDCHKNLQLSPAHGKDDPDTLADACADGIGLALTRKGDLADAATALNEAIGGLRRLGAAPGAGFDARLDLVADLPDLVDLEFARHDLAAAAATATEAMSLSRALAAEGPAYLLAMECLAVALEKSGEISHRTGDDATARASFAESLAIARRIAAASRTDAFFQRDVARALSGLAAIPGSGVSWTDADEEWRTLAGRRALFAEDRRYLTEARDQAAKANR